MDGTTSTDGTTLLRIAAPVIVIHTKIVFSPIKRLDNLDPPFSSNFFIFDL
jgi:hypothetical protein